MFVTFVANLPPSKSIYLLSFVFVKYFFIRIFTHKINYTTGFTFHLSLH